MMPRARGATRGFGIILLRQCSFRHAALQCPRCDTCSSNSSQRRKRRTRARAGAGARERA
eukprot:11640486-Alexandrium_andersonii.AAC.1